VASGHLEIYRGGEAVKRQLLVTALGIGLLIICVYFLIGIISQNSEQEALITKISDANEMIALIPEVPSDLEQRLADIEASLVSEQSKLSGQVNTTQVIDTLLDMASANQIDVVFISTTPWTLVSIENYNYLIFTISLDIEGELDALTAFLRTLEGGLPESVSVQHIVVAGDAEQAIESSLVTASMEVVIYAQAPALDDTELSQE
jgi:hypothetical protein